MEPYIVAPYLRDYLHRFAASVSAASCDYGEAGVGDDCRDEAAALRLKVVAVAAILVAGAAGVAIPLVGRRWRGGVAAGGGRSTFVLAKAFAAGVILATGLVHMMHDAEEKFQDPCLQDSLWRRFPFAGSIAMLASLVTLVVDFLGTQFYEHKQREAAAAAAATSAHDETAAALLEDGRNAGSEKREGPMHDGHGHGHGHGHGNEAEAGPSQARQVVVSQSPCTIKPLVAALSFHQFFEGFALGDCISQARLKDLSTLLMALFFAITTPTGIAVGAAMASFYDPYSPRALVVEGVLDSMSAGILIYMALVDLIAADFLGQRMSSSPARLQAGAYVALFLGAIAMASLAIWT
ncbi:zinc transporter 10-like isoform X2 [Hordeum vulgare subsp. vulgare]|uniref:zinc transporter 10-like isoform X2 n=1 Tax=Hordeum vulgare subsp. vulgare TaxID=112509 RepID=UPI001D1A3D57|nr:zinc transporter 10-like isoform X2 [Hordeum vulgare subsp. vulgare]